MKKHFLFLCFIFIGFNFIQAQIFTKFHIDSLHKEIDSTIFNIYRTKLVLYSDIGYSTAPFSVKFKDSLGDKINLIYRNNSRPVLGFGFSYKWMSLRLAFNLPGHLRSVEKFGESQYLDLGFEFKTKKRFFDVDLHNYRGYSIKSAYKWIDSLTPTKGNYIDPKMNAFSLSVNAWRFWNKNILLNCLRGKTGSYNCKQESIYLKTTINFYGLSNTTSIIPTELAYLSNEKTTAKQLAALDVGVLPGYIFVNKIKHWQFSSMLGFGPVVQIKSFSGANTRQFIGLAPRFDFRFSLSYNVDKYFASIITEFDNKSIRINDLRFRQTFYMVKIIAGIRLNTKK